jgi:hypothetical protein
MELKWLGTSGYQPFVNKIEKHNLKTRVIIPKMNEFLRF